MRKNLKIMLLGLIIMILCLTNYSFAASGNASGTVTLSASSTTVNSGDTFTVTLAQECSDGLVGVNAILDYDSSIFSLESETVASNWSDLGDKSKVLTAMSDTDIQSGDVFILTFKVNNLTASTTSQIKVTNIELYKTYSDILKIEDKAVEIKVNGEDTKNNDNNNNQSVTLSKIEIITEPSKKEYTEGEKFNPSGMVIKATYSDNSSKIITDNITYSPNTDTALTTSNKLITISYIENGVSKTATQAITVNAKNKPTNNTNVANNNSNNTNVANNNSNNTNKANTVNNLANATDNTTTDSTLPKTGSRTKYILIIIVGIIGIAFASYKGYQKYKEI